MACRIALLLLIVANAHAGAGGKEEGGSAVSPGSFRARLEFLGAELAAHGMISDLSAGSGSSSSSSDTLKLDARRTDAQRLADRVDALKRVERSLLNCKRLGDPELLQACFCSPTSCSLSTETYSTDFILSSLLIDKTSIVPSLATVDQPPRELFAWPSFPKELTTCWSSYRGGMHSMLHRIATFAVLWNVANGLTLPQAFISGSTFEQLSLDKRRSNSSLFLIDLSSSGVLWNCLGALRCAYIGH